MRIFFAATLALNLVFFAGSAQAQDKEVIAPEIAGIAEKCVLPAKAFWLDLDTVRMHPAGSSAAEDAWEMILGPAGSWEILKRDCENGDIAQILSDWSKVSNKELQRLMTARTK